MSTQLASVRTVLSRFKKNYSTKLITELNIFIQKAIYKHQESRNNYAKSMFQWPYHKILWNYLLIQTVQTASASVLRKHGWVVLQLYLFWNKSHQVLNSLFKFICTISMTVFNYCYTSAHFHFFKEGIEYRRVCSTGKQNSFMIDKQIKLFSNT